MNLTRAVLYYGSRPCPVEPSETTPLPLTFDFSNAEQCARQVLAIMSNASGGHTIRSCQIHVHAGRQTASIIGDGVVVHYAPAERSKLTTEQALQVIAERVTIYLGTVTTDQYGDGWKRAKWVKAA